MYMKEYFDTLTYPVLTRNFTTRKVNPADTFCPTDPVTLEIIRANLSKIKTGEFVFGRSEAVMAKYLDFISTNKQNGTKVAQILSEEMNGSKIQLKPNKFPYFLSHDLHHFLLCIKEGVPLAAAQIYLASHLQKAGIRPHEVYAWENPKFYRSAPEIVHFQVVFRFPQQFNPTLTGRIY